MNAKAFLTTLFLVFGIFILSAANSKAQTPLKPVFNGYKGVNIGTKVDDCRLKLGNPRDKSDTEDYFVFSENETAQILYDTDRTVRVISVNYIGKLEGAPLPKDVFGTDAEVKPDGSVNKMVRYPKAGYWISYLKTGGADPMIMITIQKMRGEQ